MRSLDKYTLLKLTEFYRVLRRIFDYIKLHLSRPVCKLTGIVKVNVIAKAQITFSASLGE